MKYEINLTDDLFVHKIRRDFEFLIHNQLLIFDPTAQTLQQKMLRAIPDFLDKNMDRVVRMLPKPEPRLPLGKWFERVFFAGLNMTLPFSELKHSVICEESNDTRNQHHSQMGELDFLIIDHRSINHIECAIKFFAYMPHLGRDLNAFVGPGGKDRLDLKLHKMQNIQLQRAIPSSLANGKHIERTLWMSGKIHYPYSEDIKDFRLLDTAKQETARCESQQRNFWSPARQLPSAFIGKTLVRLPRPWWMTTLHRLPEEYLNEFDIIASATTECMAQICEPQFIAVVEAKDHLISELHRGFILPS